MLRLLVLAALWLIALPFTFLRWLAAKLSRKPIVLEVCFEGRHPLQPVPFGWLQRHRRVGVSRRTLAVRLREAAADRRVTGLAVRIGGLEGAWGELHHLRSTLARFRAAGKRITAFVAHADTRALWLASVADEIVLPPHVPVESIGLGAEMTFLGEALDRAGVRFDVLTAGAYKSAMEPLTRAEPTPANREAIDAMLDDLYGQILDDVAAGRGRDREALRKALEDGPQTPESAVAAGLADRVLEEEKLREHLGTGRKGKSIAVDLESYPGRRRPTPQFRWRRPRLAVVHVHGTIREGREDQPEPVGATARNVVDACDRARRDRRVAGVLLHVDSRGGSATASERMWRAVRGLAAEKPVVAVMGDAAASGGYYVACAAHAIVAAPGTLTGSIGVIAAKPVVGALLSRFGIHQVRFERGPRAGMYSTSRPFNADERAAFEGTIRRMYDLFLARVAEGRGRTPEWVAPIAEGRVWTGRQALAHGLVDALGDERDAVTLLAERAGVRIPSRLQVIGGRRAGLLGLPRRSLRALSVLGDGVGVALLARREPVLAWCPVDFAD
jgi:protease-4